MSEKYNCLECGKCCRVFLIFENLITPEIEYYKLRFEPETFIQIEGNTWAYIKPCPFLDLITNECIIYPRRPLYCKRFKENSRFCKICKRLE